MGRCGEAKHEFAYMWLVSSDLKLFFHIADGRDTYEITVVAAREEYALVAVAFVKVGAPAASAWA